MSLIGSLWDSSAAFHRDAAHSALSADRAGFPNRRGARWSPPLFLSLHSHTFTHTHTASLICRHTSTTTTRHPNVSVSSRWIVLRNLELSQVIPNNFNLQKVDSVPSCPHLTCAGSKIKSRIQTWKNPTKSPHSQTLEMLCGGFRGGCTEDVETLADRAVLPVQSDISQSLKDWLLNIKRGN